jgi:hypothetical protein
MIKKKVMLLLLSVLSVFVLVACSSKSSSANTDISGTWSARYGELEFELVATTDSFSMDGTYEVEGLFSTSKETIRVMSGNVDTKSGTLVITSYNDDIFDGDLDTNPKITYNLSENGTLSLTVDGDKLLFKKSN